MAQIPGAVVSDGGGNATAAVRLVDLTKGGDGRWIIGIMIALVSCVFGTLGLLMSKLAHTYEASKPVRAWCCGTPPHSWHTSPFVLSPPPSHSPSPSLSLPPSQWPPHHHLPHVCTTLNTTFFFFFFFPISVSVSVYASILMATAPRVHARRVSVNTTSTGARLPGWVF